MAIADEQHDPKMDALYRDIEAAELFPLWLQQGVLTRTPRPKAIPYRWDGGVIRALVERAGELVAVDRGGDRRVLACVNPGLGGAPWATPTLWAAIQYLKAGESAPSHRHSPSALRFVIDGDGVSTTVDGDACSMHPGDLVLTPAWTWHEHLSTSDRPMVWFDGLDIPLVNALDAMFFEPHPTGYDGIRGHNLSERFASVGRLPGGVVPTPSSPLLVYRWGDTDAALARLVEQNPRAASFDFVNPSNGGPVLPTIGCAMHRVPSATSTIASRRSASRVFLVYRGSGRSYVDDATLEWQAGDVLAIPSWTKLHHQADEDADLFECTDAPVLRALHLYREEVLESD